MSDQEAIGWAQARYAKDCDRFHKRVFATTGEVVIMGNLTAVALFRNGRLTAAYRITDRAVDDLDGVYLGRLRELLARRKAQSGAEE
jgi:hypothetical protein